MGNCSNDDYLRHVEASKARMMARMRARTLHKLNESIDYDELKRQKAMGNAKGNCGIQKRKLFDAIQANTQINQWMHGFYNPKAEIKKGAFSIIGGPE